MNSIKFYCALTMSDTEPGSRNAKMKDAIKFLSVFDRCAYALFLPKHNHAKTSPI